jgi:hypothetical protein
MRAQFCGWFRAWQKVNLNPTLAPIYHLLSVPQLVLLTLIAAVGEQEGGGGLQKYSPLATE